MQKQVRELHYPASSNGTNYLCIECDVYWPCPTGEVVYSDAEIKYQLSYTTNFREFWEPNTIQDQEAYPTKSIPYGGGAA